MSEYDQRGNDGRRPRSVRDDEGRTPGPRPPGPPGGRFIWVLFFGLLAFGLVFLFNQTRTAGQEEITLSEFDSRLDAIKTAVIGRGSVTGEYRSKTESGQQKYRLVIQEEQGEEIAKMLRDYNAGKPEAERIEYEMERTNEFLQFLLIQLLPIALLLLIIWFFLARQFRGAGGAGSVLSFGKARARLHSKEKSDVKFDDVAGVEEAKEEVMELVEFLKNPPNLKRLGGRIPRGVLLVGPPGCGKTLLARAIAGEADVPFFSISGSDFIEMFVGVGASRVRDLFRQAKENSPCIIFLDEIDAVGRRRTIDLHGASAESAQTLNAILVEMDGFDTDDNIIVVAATNRPDVLDPALRRPGRFDRQVDMDLPDIRGREAILKVHAKKYKLASDVDMKVLGRGTPGFSGADLEAMLNEATLIATRKGKRSVGMADCEEARDKVRWGRQKRSLVMSDEVKKITAYHESGHAITAKLLPKATPLHKVSIIPQGRALGLTMSLPEQDRLLVMRQEMLDQICVSLAGRVTEEMFFDDVDSGSENDLNHATDIARNMVCRWGMSEALGPVSYHEYDEPVYAGPEPHRGRGFSEATAIKIDAEIERIMRECDERVRTLLRERRDEVERIAQALLKYEVLYAEDVDKILAGEELTRPVINDDAVKDGEAASDAPPETLPDAEDREEHIA